MSKILGLEQSRLWDEIVKSFNDFDVYYLSGYVKAFQIHGDGDPYLFYYEEGKTRGVYVYLKRKTAIENVYDSITPYGYGGFLIEGDKSEERIVSLWKTYIDRMNEEHIVDNFVRYHPVLENANYMRCCSDVLDLGNTIDMDLSDSETIWNNMASTTRNRIRKAEKNGVVVKHGKSMELMDSFMSIYYSTMDKDDADDYYYFKKPFFESIHIDLKDNYEMFWAEYDGKIIAMDIIIYANGRLNYHLGGTLKEYLYLSPSNLIHYQVALWGCELGYKTYHLGGGVGSEQDNLYRFKSGFNKKSNRQFSIAKHIFDMEKYFALVGERALRDKEYNTQSGFFPVYRA